MKNILFPLDVVYRRAGIELPRARVASPYDIPLPYRSLLVHESDMTLTLEQHFGGRVALRVLSTYRSRQWFFRRVLLVQEYSGRPVEMGAIRVDLGVLKPRVRSRILRNEVPLGRILRDEGAGFRTPVEGLPEDHLEFRDDGGLLAAGGAHAVRPPDRGILFQGGQDRRHPGGTAAGVNGGGPVTRSKV